MTPEYYDEWVEALDELWLHLNGEESHPLYVTFEGLFAKTRNVLYQQKLDAAETVKTVIKAAVAQAIDDDADWRIGYAISEQLKTVMSVYNVNGTENDCTDTGLMNDGT